MCDWVCGCALVWLCMYVDTGRYSGVDRVVRVVLCDRGGGGNLGSNREVSRVYMLCGFGIIWFAFFREWLVDWLYRYV